MDRSPDARLALAARRQAGAFDTAQARRAGLSAAMLRRRVGRGEIERVDETVWWFTTAPATWLRDCWAVTLTHPRAALSHRTAAAQLGLGVDHSRPLHVTVPLDADHRSRSVEVRGRRASVP